MMGGGRGMCVEGLGSSSVFICVFFFGEEFVNLGKNLKIVPPSPTPHRVNANTSETLDF